MPSYLSKPIGVRDWNVVNAIMPTAAIPVEDGGEVRKIAVQVNVLGVGAAIGPTVQQVTLKCLGSNDWER